MNKKIILNLFLFSICIASYANNDCNVYKNPYVNSICQTLDNDNARVQQTFFNDFKRDLEKNYGAVGSTISPGKTIQQQVAPAPAYVAPVQPVVQQPVQQPQRPRKIYY